MIEAMNRLITPLRHWRYQGCSDRAFALARWQTGALLVLMLTSAVSVPAAAAEAATDAQAFEERLREAEAELDAAARKLREVYQSKYTDKERPRKKAMLGVLVEYDKSDDGVLLTGLTPGGGAETAGLRARDVLISINGVRLDDPNDGRSSMKALTEQMADVVPGDSVAVEPKL